jgi:3-deoxy-D-manno-octulosonic-acid transferase
MYSIAWYLLLVPLWLVFIVKMLIGLPGYTRHRLSRFSLFNRKLTQSTLLWHCVSVGEVMCVTPLIEKILASNPDLTITITTTTETGANQVYTNFGDRVQHCYLPYDCGLLMRRLVNRILPKALLITEVELWPNLINITNTRGIPIALINARMTNRSATNYAKLGRFFTASVTKIQIISAQSQRDKDNYQRLGVSADKVKNNGNIKFELSSANAQDAIFESLSNKAHSANCIIIIAASTHEPEESMIVAAHKQLALSGVNIQTWLVPRHPQRFDQVASLLGKSNVNYLRYTQLTEQKAADNDANVILIDAMGVLSTAFAKSDIAFIGGSFAEKGGHNALEAAQHNLPVVMGPSQYNNPEIYDKLAQVANLATAHNQTELEKILLTWCENIQQRLSAGNAGYAVIQQNRGALAANQKLIEELIE